MAAKDVLNSQNIYDLRIILQQEFVARCDRNEKYSLRSFARDLGIGPAQLSEILRSKRSLTEPMVQRLCKVLGFNDQETEKFVQGSVSPRYQQLEADTYAIIADWYHYAILELTKLKSFQPSVEYVSKRLNISNEEVEGAVERLVRVGLLSVTPEKWTDLSYQGNATNIQMNGELTSAAAKSLQRQVLDLSAVALENVSTDLRSHSTITVAIDPADLLEAKIRIVKFRRELAAFFEKTQNPSQVYNLAISLFPITASEELS